MGFLCFSFWLNRTTDSRTRYNECSGSQVIGSLTEFMACAHTGYTYIQTESVTSRKKKVMYWGSQDIPKVRWIPECDLAAQRKTWQWHMWKATVLHNTRIQTSFWHEQNYHNMHSTAGTLLPAVFSPKTAFVHSVYVAELADEQLATRASHSQASLGHVWDAL